MSRRIRAAGAALLAGLALAGCGVQGSDVVEAGEAPDTIVRPNPENRMLLFFLGPDGELMPVSREVGFTFVPVPERTEPGGGTDGTDGTGGTDGTADRRLEGAGGASGVDAGHPYAPGVAAVKVLAALISGPGGADRAAGLTTELPESAELIRVESDGADGIRLQTPFLTQELSEAAVAQLVCTAAHAVDRKGTSTVTVAGPDGSLPAATCPRPES
ncbi:hypothetical protein ACFYOG_10290 [Streptomyces sp. NPDC007818]|uniref:hypothetical protein n=1 Tax=Streptomyces sp. NPDC007818 TaxID=3364780 RepID=UPI0036BB02BE